MVTEARRRWYKKNYQRLLDYAREWNHNNPERRKIIAQKYRNSSKGKATSRTRHHRNYVLNKDKHVLRKREWEAKNREKVTQAVCRRLIRARMQLRDWYIRRLLSVSTCVPAAMWPQELVKLKREELKLKRLWQPQRALKN